MKKTFCAILLGMTVLTLSSCGSSKRASGEAGATAPMAAAAKAAGSYDFGNYMADEAVMDSESYYEESADYEAPEAQEQGSETIGEGEASSAEKSKRKLITTVNLETESDDVEGFSESIERKIQAMGGYVESSNIYAGSGNYDNYYNSTSKSAEITARIPAERLDEFLNDVDGSSNIVRKSVNTRDVTLEYTDTEAHERALSAEQKSLEKMMEHAESIEDILSIQTQLTDVRYRLDSIRSQLRTYDNDITYSTVHISVTETREFTVTKEETAWERIQKGFVDNLLDVMDAVAEFIIYFISHIPALIVLGIVIAVIVLIVKKARKSSAKKKEAARAKREQAAKRAAGGGETVEKDEPVPEEKESKEESGNE